MTEIKTDIDGAYIIEPDIIGDSRGWFYESYSEKKFRDLGIDAVFVQDNRSFSAKKDTLRGLHCQREPAAQAKLVSCTRGEIIDVAVDIRKDSPTYLKHIKVLLSEENKRMLFIPKGCLHGFVTLTDDVELFYKVDAPYSPENDRSIKYDDPDIGIDWGDISPVLSEKDKNAPLLRNSDLV
jgi:dTDP-4-dehydrorhamnose 3,5-epimerase